MTSWYFESTRLSRLSMGGSIRPDSFSAMKTPGNGCRGARPARYTRRNRLTRAHQVYDLSPSGPTTLMRQRCSQVTRSSRTPGFPWPAVSDERGSLTAHGPRELARRYPILTRVPQPDLRAHPVESVHNRNRLGNRQPTLRLPRTLECSLIWVPVTTGRNNLFKRSELEVSPRTEHLRCPVLFQHRDALRAHPGRAKTRSRTHTAGLTKQVPRKRHRINSQIKQCPTAQFGCVDPVSRGAAEQLRVIGGEGARLPRGARRDDLVHPPHVRQVPCPHRLTHDQLCLSCPGCHGLRLFGVEGEGFFYKHMLTRGQREQRVVSV